MRLARSCSILVSWQCVGILMGITVQSVIDAVSCPVPARRNVAKRGCVLPRHVSHRSLANRPSPQMLWRLRTAHENRQEDSSEYTNRRTVRDFLLVVLHEAWSFLKCKGFSVFVWTAVAARHLDNLLFPSCGIFARVPKAVKTGFSWFS